ncbi:hypothetical protein HID58_037819 [Brassica napus]|uniref:Uncharacterized protein n=1 Tax=Brassica napus TaxID=3708 RepID=A0ABQ8BNA6_BRANA|nr:hypothetical protein HID58_037819 [Brassica napus]
MVRHDYRLGLVTLPRFLLRDIAQIWPDLFSMVVDCAPLVVLWSPSFLMMSPSVFLEVVVILYWQLFVGRCSLSLWLEGITVRLTN